MAFKVSAPRCFASAPSTSPGGRLRCGWGTAGFDPAGLWLNTDATVYAVRIKVLDVGGAAVADTVPVAAVEGTRLLVACPMPAAEAAALTAIAGRPFRLKFYLDGTALLYAFLLSRSSQRHPRHILRFVKRSRPTRGVATAVKKQRTLARDKLKDTSVCCVSLIRLCVPVLDVCVGDSALGNLPN
jgi:hypothetical protein